jgi:hypothetical protein
MTRRSSVSLAAVLVIALAVAGVISAGSSSTNSAQVPNAFTVGSPIESTAFYCTGLSDASGGASGVVRMVNTASTARALTIDVGSNTGQIKQIQHEVGAYGVWSLNPATVVPGGSFGVGVTVTGGGVFGAEVTDSGTALAPCVASGVTQWYGAGFNTTVGSKTFISIYNPTSTAAVLNITTDSSSGYSAPARFQGLAIGGHSQVEIDLGSEIVNAVNVGVHVGVLRGSVVVTGVQLSGSLASFNPGVGSASAAAVFPLVTTVSGATAQIRVANPGATSATVTFKISLDAFSIHDETLTVSPYSSAIETITPNSAIPAHGYAMVRMSSTTPVYVALATGAGSDIALSSPGTPTSNYLVGDFAKVGFDGAVVTNTSSSALTVHFASAVGEAATASAPLDAGATAAISSLFASTLRATYVFVTASSPALLVTLTLPSRPAGQLVVAPLDGR